MRASKLRVLALVGGTASGKSTIARALVSRLGRGRAALLSQDSYYRDLTPLPPAERARTNFDDPAALELSRLADDIESLRAGEPVRPPVYDMRTHTRIGEGDPVGPCEFLILDGHLLLADPRIAEVIDLIVYVDLDDGSRLQRRVHRDAGERARTETEISRRWVEDVRPMHEEHVEPTRAWAHLVVRGDGPVSGAVEQILAHLG